MNYRSRHSLSTKERTKTKLSTSSNSAPTKTEQQEPQTMCRSTNTSRTPSPSNRRQRSLGNNDNNSNGSEHLSTTSRSASRSQGLMGYFRKSAGAARRRLRNEGFRQAFLPRRPACLDLPTTQNDEGSGSFHFQTNSNHSSNNKNSSEHTRATSMSTSTRNVAWDEENPPKTRIKLLEDLKNEPTKTREDLQQSTGGANLDDLIDMAYKIRVSYEFDWEKLLEEDIEEEDDADVANEDDVHKLPTKTHLPEPKRRTRKRPSMEMCEKPAVHLHHHRENRPAFGPGILIS